MAYVNRSDVAFIVAYLVGATEENLTKNYYNCEVLHKNLKNNQDASIIRYLCKLRTSIMKNFKNTDDALRFQNGSLTTLDWFDSNDIEKLREWGIRVLRGKCYAESYLKHFCKLIEENIDNCKKIFPEWINWNYIKSLFVIPNSLKKQRVLSEVEKFESYIKYYPYSMYIYWKPFECSGMLLNDKVFLESLYSLHNEKFLDKSKYTDVSKSTINNINTFIKESNTVEIVVDCENTDVYKLYGFLNTLPKETIRKINKVVLYDDANTVETWKTLSKYIPIQTEYIIVERVLERKSLVDIKMSAGICKSHYRDGVDSFIMVSSDSDYWGVISSLPEAKFMVVFEDSKISKTTLGNLNDNNILSCSLDDFNSDRTKGLKEEVLVKTLNQELESKGFNCKSIIDNIYKTTHIKASKEEKDVFYDKFVKSISVTIDEKSNLKIKIC